MNTITIGSRVTWRFTRGLSWAAAPDRALSTPADLTAMYSPAAGLTGEARFEAWADEAMKLASVAMVDDRHVAEVDGLPDVFFDDETPEAALAGLRPVLMDWAEIALEIGAPVPMFGGIDLNP